MNAERLFNDAQKGVSEPTAAALFELSLEELSKSYALLFRYIDEQRDAAGRSKAIKLISRSLGKKTLPQFSKADREKIKKATKGIDLGAPMTIDEFGNHEVKLERVQAVVKYVKAVIPIMMRYADRQAILTSRGAGLINLDAVEKGGANENADYLQVINEDKITELLLHKEKGFYVDYDGTFRSPSAQVFPTAAIAYLVGALLSALKWDIQFYLDF